MSFFRLSCCIVIVSALLGACGSGPSTTQNVATDTTSQDQATSPDFLSQITLYASFDSSPDADFAKGDPSFYTAPSRKQLEEAQAGLHNTDHSLESDGGRFGGAFHFGNKSDTVVYFKANNNIVYDSSAWTGSISFWLKVDPEKELAPGYTDPIQITDVRYNDASIWVDFTQDEPRDFRLGVFGDLDVWSQDTLDTSADEEFDRRCVRVKNPPFNADTWTHVFISYEQLGNETSTASLYLNGEKKGTVAGIDDPYTWDVGQANIYLGLSFIGRMDELAIFARPFNEEEVKQLYELEEGIKPYMDSF